jgi:hypothetical protein
MYTATSSLNMSISPLMHNWFDAVWMLPTPDW